MSEHLTRASHSVILYTGQHCHLCHLAKDIVYQVLKPGWVVSEISITGDAELEQRYGARIPVVAINGVGEKGWPFTAGQIRRMMAQVELANPL
jgi:hypothetical protein